MDEIANARKRTRQIETGIGIVLGTEPNGRGASAVRLEWWGDCSREMKNAARYDSM